MQMIALFFLAAASIGGVTWVFIYPILSGERQAEQRQERVVRAEPVARATNSRNTPKVRREQIEDTLKELEVRNKKQKNLPLAIRISQAGLDWSKRQFFIFSAIFGAAMFVVVFIVGGSLIAAVGAGFAGGFGAPRWLLGFLKKRRENKFRTISPMRSM